MKALPHITNKQQEILKLLYRFRFLERKQIQAFLGHRNKGQISRWLKDLKEKQFIEWFYEPDNPTERSKPAIYYLGLNGIRSLKELDEGGYPVEELRKRYAESSRKQAFIDHCLLLADGCLGMEARAIANDNLEYTYSLEADYLDPDNDYNFLAESEFIRPNLCYLKVEEDEDDVIEMYYLVEILAPATPRYMVRKKIKDYVAFLDSGDWEDGMEGVELPIVHLTFSTLAELIYAKRCARKFLKDIEQDDNEDFCIRFATVEQIKRFGLTGKIWEDT